MSNFKASLLVDNCSSLEVSCDCKKISFKDTSNYSTNTTPGHESTDFTSRVITITRGDNSTFQLITADVRTNNPTLYPLSKENITYKIIPPHNISNNTFSYTFLSTDEDGIWKVELCTYPNWRDDITYQAILKPIVLFQGKLYQAIVDSVNVNPANDTNNVYWVDYVDTSDCSDTRYCTTQRIAITCISIENCYRDAVASAFCAIENNPCKNMCDNKDFMKAMKMRVVMDGLEFASCGLDWATAQKHMDVLKSLCCCN
jgi:hypothetical protein